MRSYTEYALMGVLRELLNDGSPKEQERYFDKHRGVDGPDRMSGRCPAHIAHYAGTATPSPGPATENATPTPPRRHSP